MYISTIVIVDNKAYFGSTTVRTNEKMTMANAIALAHKMGFEWASPSHILLTSVPDNNIAIIKQTKSATVGFSVGDILDIIIPEDDYDFTDITVRELVREEAIRRVAHSLRTSVFLTLPEGDVNVVATVEWMV